MAKIFNLNHDVYINCHYVPFYNFFKSTEDLNFGDMISLKKIHLNYLKIIGLDNKLIKPNIINNTKCILEEYITSYLYNPIVHYQQHAHPSHKHCKACAKHAHAPPPRACTCLCDFHLVEFSHQPVPSQ